MRKLWWQLERSTRWRLNYLSRLRAIAGWRNPKVFCIGRNKTGTTSIAAALARLGYRVGRQRDAELLLEDWGRRDFRRLIDYCHSADAFQDTPFSQDYTFQAVDAAFSGSKFILTERGSPEEWYRSTVRFHTKRLGLDHVPTAQDLQNDTYVYRGWFWRKTVLMFGSGNEAPFDEATYKTHYVRHNERVMDYFRHRPEHLLVLDPAEPDAMRRLC